MNNVEQAIKDQTMFLCVFIPMIIFLLFMIVIYVSRLK